MSEILSMIDPNNYGLQSMVAGGADLQEKTATPTTSQQVIQADEGYDGLSSVTVNAVTSAIDENIIPTNIRTGKTILGVQGNLEPDKPDQNKTVTPSTVQQVVVADTGYELAQVTVEAVPDETPELNAQDTALSNQETVIGQLSSALDNKIALDLQAATSDANATAGDIAKNKTAYVNGVKVTGNAETPDYFYNTIMNEYNYGGNLAKMVKTIPSDTTIQGTSASSLFSYCRGLVEIPALDTQNITNMSYMFSNCVSLVTVPTLKTNNVTTTNAMFVDCTSLVTAPQLNLSNNTNANSMFLRCSSLENVPIYDFGKVTNMGYIFGNCPNLTNTSLNNIMEICINVTRISGHNKSLAALGLSQTQAETCMTLSNYNDFVSAGWSTGY